MEKEIKYLGLIQNGKIVGTMQTILQDEELIEFIDEIFDMGLTLTKIDKEDYDKFDGEDINEYDIEL
jgi:hypothetical protein